MGEDEWRVSDLLDDEQSIVKDAKLARQVLEVLGSLSESEINVRVPKAAVEFAENTLSEWFEIIAEIEKKRGNIPYLINRELYNPNMDGAPEWDQGLQLKDWEHWLNDPGFMERFDQHFHLTKLHQSTKTDEPLSGYYNRMFPVKFVLRVLAALSLIGTHEVSKGEEDWEEDSEQVTLTDLRKVGLEHALYAREYLTGLDRITGALKNIGSEIAVGFPESSDKAKERFVAQFVGSKRKKQLSGALIEMGFVNLPKFLTFTMDEVHFTPEGWNFVMMPNPILDNPTQGWMDYVKTGSRFSVQEIEFLLNHFEKNIPAEWQHLKHIANLINKGDNRPKVLEAKLVSIYGWESTKASQMRNGAVSRMEELSLISREKHGREVTYKLTKLGEEKLL
jgi:hypothetical protein